MYPSRPSQEKALQEFSESTGDSGQSFPSIGNEAEFQFCDRIDQAAHHHPPVPAGEQRIRRDHGYPLAGFYHRNLGIEQIDRYLLRDSPTGLRYMFINKLLNWAGRLKRDQTLFF